MQLYRNHMFGRGRRVQAAVTATCLCAFVLFGYDQGVFSGIVNNANWLDTFGHPSSGLEGIIVAIYNLGAFSGCILTFFIGEKIGRRWCIFIAMIWIIVGAILQCTAYSVSQLMIARYITGIGTGIDTSTVPMYQSENCDPRIRGRIVSVEPLFVGVGIVISYYFDYGMSLVPGPTAWRVPIACQVVFAFACIFLVLGVPESARWLFYHGRGDEAVDVLCEIHDAGPDDLRVVEQKNEILEAIVLLRKNGEYQWSQLFKRDEVQTGRRVMLAWFAQLMNQVGGINFVVYFVPSALEQNVGLEPNLALLIGGAVQVCFIIGSIVPSLFLDRLGRRKPMIWGSAGLSLSMAMLAILLSFQQPQYSKELGKSTASASIAFFFIYMLIFGASMNCIPWVYVPEILPLNARAKGSAIGISSNWLWNFTIVMITPTLIDKLAWKGYIIFAVTNAAFIPVIYYLYPETKNLTLEEVDHLFLKEGRSGVSALAHKSRPVEESLRKDVRRRHSSVAVTDVESGREKDVSASAEHFERGGARSAS